MESHTAYRAMSDSDELSATKLDMSIRKIVERPETEDQGLLKEALHKRMAQARLHAEQLRGMAEDSERPNLSLPIH